MTGLNIRAICILGILFGLCMNLIKSENVKKTVMILFSVTVVILFLAAVKELDIAYFSEQLSVFREKGITLGQSADDISDRLNRLVIEQECQSYIMDVVQTRGYDITNVRVRTQWSDEGVWVPYEAEIEGKRSDKIEQLLLSELGIAPERIIWNENE